MALTFEMEKCEENDSTCIMEDVIAECTDGDEESRQTLSNEATLSP